VSDPRVPQTELWTLAFVPEGGDGDGLDRRLAAAVEYARREGLEVVGVRVALRVPDAAPPRPDAPPIGVRVRRLVKFALRACGLRGVDYRSLGISTHVLNALANPPRPRPITPPSQTSQTGTLS
jgi:hypothetical protein